MDYRGLSLPGGLVESYSKSSWMFGYDKSGGTYWRWGMLCVRARARARDEERVQNEGQAQGASGASGL